MASFSPFDYLSERVLERESVLGINEALQIEVAVTVHLAV